MTAQEFAAVPGLQEVTVDGPLLRGKLSGRADALVKAAARHTVVTLSVEEADLEEIFFHHYANNRRGDDVA